MEERLGNSKYFTPEEKHYIALNGAKYMILNYELDFDSSSMDEFLNSLIPNISKNMDFMDWFFENIYKWMEEEN